MDIITLDMVILIFIITKIIQCHATLKEHVHNDIMGDSLVFYGWVKFVYFHQTFPSWSLEKSDLIQTVSVCQRTNKAGICSSRVRLGCLRLD